MKCYPTVSKIVLTEKVYSVSFLKLNVCFPSAPNNNILNLLPVKYRTILVLMDPNATLYLDQESYQEKNASKLKGQGI